MKKLFSLFVALIATCALGASNVITYKATSKLGEVTSYSDIGFHTNAFNVSISSHTFSNGTGTITFAGEVTSIGYLAFYSCKSLTSITIPNSVTSIGDYAFQYCSALTSVTIGNSVTSIGEHAFFGCRGLTSITIPNSVTSIGAYAFYDCDGLTSITIPNSVTSIGSRAFYHSDGLTDIYMEGNVPPTVGSYLYPSSVTVHVPCSSQSAYRNAGWENAQEPDPDYAVEVTSDSKQGSIYWIKRNSCTNQIEFEARPRYGYHFVQWSDGNTDNPRSVILSQDTTFSALFAQTYSGPCGENAYWEYANGTLRITGIGEVNSSEWGLFADSITTLIISDGITTIPEGAFAGLSHITTVTIPNSVTSIGDGAFNECTGLTSVAIGNSVTTIGNRAFNGCSGLTSITIPNSVTSIGDGAFSECTGLTSVAIGNSVTTIGNRAFNGCSGLTSITIPNSVTSIGDGAFSGCIGLRSVVLGGSLTSIGEEVFSGCTKLFDITCYAVEPPVANANSFANYNVYLNILCDNLQDYQLDVVFGSFKYIRCIEAEGTTVSTVTVASTENDATFAWPTTAGASTYTLTITKNGEIVCTFTFNANGQLLNIAFVPGRDGASHAQAADLIAEGYQFTVTGLEEGASYSFTLDAKDAGNNVVANYSGTFITTGGEMGVENVNKYVTTPTKFLRDGQVLIQRGNRLYDLRGQEVK